MASYYSPCTTYNATQRTAMQPSSTSRSRSSTKMGWKRLNTGRARFYAVVVGRETGIFDSFRVADGHTRGYSGSQQRAFSSRKGAQDYMLAQCRSHTPLVACRANPCPEKALTDMNPTDRLVQIQWPALPQKVKSLSPKKMESLSPRNLKVKPLTPSKVRPLSPHKPMTTPSKVLVLKEPAYLSTPRRTPPRAVDKENNASAVKVIEKTIMTTTKSERGTTTTTTITTTTTTISNCNAASTPPRRQPKRSLPEPTFLRDVGEDVGTAKDEDPQDSFAYQPPAKRRRRMSAAAANTTLQSPPRRRPEKLNLQIHILFDGGCRGRPSGVGGAGACVTIHGAWADDDSSRQASFAPRSYHVRHYIGDKTTSNEAEYHACIQGLLVAKREASRLRHSVDLLSVELIVRGDSLLVIEQLRGEYRCKGALLRPLYQKASELMGSFSRLGKSKASLEHIYRLNNSKADDLANQAMDSRRSWFTMSDDNHSLQLDTRVFDDRASLSNSNRRESLPLPQLV